MWTVEPSWFPSPNLSHSEGQRLRLGPTCSGERIQAVDQVSKPGGVCKDVTVLGEIPLHDPNHERFGDRLESLHSSSEAGPSALPVVHGALGLAESVPCKVQQRTDDLRNVDLGAVDDDLRQGDDVVNDGLGRVES